MMVRNSAPWVSAPNAGRRISMTMDESKTCHLHRRDFLAAAAGTAAVLMGTRGAARTATGAPPPPPQVPLGKTGITLSRVGQGTGMSGGNRQSNHTRMGFEKLVALLRHSYERGI